MPANREWPNRGGKPLVSVEIDGGIGGPRCFAPTHVVPRRFEAMRLIKRCVPKKLMRDFPMRGEV